MSTILSTKLVKLSMSYLPTSHVCTRLSFCFVFSGGTAVFIDAEHALDATYARAIGVDMTNLYLAQPDNGEQGAKRRAIPVWHNCVRLKLFIFGEWVFQPFLHDAVYITVLPLLFHILRVTHFTLFVLQSRFEARLLRF